jgi:hypothetical protein
MRMHVQRLWADVNSGLPVRHLEPFLGARQIRGPEAVQGLHCDGFIEPIGSCFEQGFRMLLKKGQPVTRTRFTTAHEICHTFFYQVVPELKFVPHDTDEDEEKLCNLGAAELLVPPSDLRDRAADTPRCLKSLERLAMFYGVSLELMLLRLRTLSRWSDCQLTVWRQLSDGRFVLSRLYGGKHVGWRWTESVLIAPHGLKVTAGVTWIECEDAEGRCYARRVHYQVTGRGHSAIALWSDSALEQAKPEMPLFAHERATPHLDKARVAGGESRVDCGSRALAARVYRRGHAKAS